METKVNIDIFTEKQRLGSISRTPYQDAPKSVGDSSLLKIGRMLWKCICKRGVAWKMIKNVLFFACCSFFFIQSIEFYNQYSSYPTTTSIAVVSPKYFKLPAITFCDKNIVWRTHFCAEYPDSCQKPNDIGKFCQHHPAICEKNASNVMIPKFGYYTNISQYSLGEKAWQLFLKIATKSFPTHVPPYLRFRNWEITYVPGDNDLPYAVCYSRNLRIFSQDEQETQEPYDEYKGGNKVQDMYIPSKEYEAFYPFMISPIFFSIHSSVIPENPLTMGKRLRLGHKKRNTFCHFPMQPIAPITMPYGDKTTKKDHGLSRSVL
ncbi:uncharacterized protein CDAR_525301 [Caerostris darwini]|uniref:Uncharacterized protein n=1 Tax=Caerostris darwini TaxID=1538125 RepID=A0AAV4RQX8_9ARAC|nr:uncharacterized protein CDAR_525301 [Caerostris darwini]